jgi:hypothetical protein
VNEPKEPTGATPEPVDAAHGPENERPGGSDSVRVSEKSDEVGADSEQNSREIGPERNGSPVVRGSRWIDYDTHELLEMISELEDERRWARLREGLWIAILVHLVLLSSLTWIPRYIFKVPPVIDPFEAIKQRKDDLKYLDLPPDLLKRLQPKAAAKAVPNAVEYRQEDSGIREQGHSSAASHAGTQGGARPGSASYACAQTRDAITAGGTAAQGGSCPAQFCHGIGESCRPVA